MSVFFLLALLYSASLGAGPSLGGADGFVERMGAGARELGRGNTGSADTASQPAAFWNPALVAASRKPRVGLHAERRSLDRVGGSLGGNFPVGSRMGLGAGLLFRGDANFAVVDEDDRDLGTSRPQFMLGFIAVGWRPDRRSALGLGLVMGYENLDMAKHYSDVKMVDSYQTPTAFQLGYQRHLSPRWDLGVVVRNLGVNRNLSARFSTSRSRDNTLPGYQGFRPKVLQVGLLHHAKLQGQPLRLYLEVLDYQLADTLAVFDPDWHAWRGRTGIEWEAFPGGCLRTGLDNGNWSLGASYRFRVGKPTRPLEVDWALLRERTGQWTPLSVGMRTGF